MEQLTWCGGASSGSSIAGGRRSMGRGPVAGGDMGSRREGRRAEGDLPGSKSGAGVREARPEVGAHSVPASPQVRLCHHAQVAQQDHGGEAVGAALDQELPVRWALVAGAPQLPLSPAAPQLLLSYPSAAPEPGCCKSHGSPWTLLGAVNLSPPCRAVEGRGPDACMTSRASEEAPAFVQLGPRSTHHPPRTPRSLDHLHPEDHL